MKRLLLILVLALASFSVLAATAAADNGVSNVSGVFTPNPVAYGGTTRIVVGVAQTNTPYKRDATFTLSNLPPQLIFMGHGDTDPHTVCSQSGTTVTCHYTDAAYSSKHDPFYFSFGPTSKAQCKKNGWMDFGSVFKNQGDCVSFIATGGSNPPTGAVPSGAYTVQIDVSVTDVGSASKDVNLTLTP